MGERDQLPTKQMIAAVSDIQALYGWKDEIELRITHIETNLEFRPDDDDWAHRARNALALHRYADRLIARRIAKLKSAEPKGEAPTRPDTDNDPLTVEVLAKWPEIDVAAITETPTIDERSAWITARINAVAADRDDEIALNPGDRDEGFLAATGSALRHMRGLRAAIQNRRGEISKAARVAAAQERDTRREALFIEACRTILDRDTFVRVWERVDQMEAFDAAKAGAA